MSSFFNLLPEGSNVNLEKCGDVVVSPKDNIVALFCHFCSDIFTQLPEFARHLQSSHSDILPFSKENNVYSVEELLSQQDEEHDDPSQSDSSSSGDSGLPAEGDDEDNKEQQKEPDACQFNAKILEALAANDIEVDVPPDNLGRRDLLAEVEAMLFEDANLSDNKAEDIQKTPPPKEDQSETKIVKESTYCQVETNHNTKGYRQSRNKTEQRSLSICDLKSYSITRMSRKREMKRMSSVKMRIMRSLEIEEMGAKSLTNPYANPTKDNIKVKQEPKERKLKLSALKEAVEKENRNILPKDFTDLKTSLIKPAIVSQTASKSLMSYTSNTKSPESFKKPFVPKDPLRSTSKLKSNTKFVQIDKIEILPTLNIKEEKPKPLTMISMNSSSQLGGGNTTVENESYAMPKKSQNDSIISLKTYQKTDSAKGRHETKVEIKRPKVETSPSSLNFSLSDSVIEFLQNDLSSTELNSVDSLLQLAMPSENDSPNQMKMDQEASINSNTETAVKPIIFNDDLTLLRMVGLPIIKIPTIEDKLDIDVYESLHQKATQFSQILHSFKVIWNRRKSGLLTQNLSQQFNMFTEELNRKLGVQLKVTELKRILNLINIWHREQIELVYFKKIRLSSDMKFYFQLFGFLPKINRFLFYCEHCEQMFNYKIDYKEHRLEHQTKMPKKYCEKV